MKVFRSVNSCLMVVLSTLLFAGMTATMAQASELPSMDDLEEQDQAELMELMAVLEEETEIATKTKMNSDYVPGIVTVLHGDQLEALGIRNVSEALSLVPGIQSYLERKGEPSTRVRGYNFPYNAGNIKVLLNSITLSRESSGQSPSVLLMPVEQVDRIEVIRGPGSSIYGDFAMVGVVNIITRDTGGKFFGRAGNDQSRSGGSQYYFRDEENSLSTGFNLALVDEGENAASMDTDPEGDLLVGVYGLEYKNTSLKMEGVLRNLDYLFQPPRAVSNGQVEEVSEDMAGQKASDYEGSYALEGRQAFEPWGGLNAEAWVTYLDNAWKTDFPDEVFRGYSFETGLDLKWTWSRHRFLIGSSYMKANINEALAQIPSLPPGSISVAPRQVYAVNIQDQIEFGDRFSLTLGGRYDHYSDVGDLLTPRIGAVYRFAENHLVKAQYSEGFRAPTFWEVYRYNLEDRPLDFQIMGTTELSYIYRRPNMTGRLTLYQSRTNTTLGPVESNLVRMEDRNSRGVEAEWEQKLFESLRLMANLSYTDSWDKMADGRDQPIPGVADWLGNLALFYTPTPNLLVSGRLLHLGRRHTLDGWFDGYDTLDLTVSRMDLIKKGLTLRAGVKNLFDEDILYLNSIEGTLTSSEYPGRSFWAQVSYSF